MISIFEALIYVAVGLLCGITVFVVYSKIKMQSAKEVAQKILDDAGKEVESIKREALLEAKEDALKVKNELERETRERRADTQRLEKRLLQKEESLDRKYEVMEKKEDLLTKKENEVDKIRTELQTIHQKHRNELERISGLHSDEAKTILLKDVEEEIQQEIAIKIRDLEESQGRIRSKSPRNNYTSHSKVCGGSCSGSHRFCSSASQ